MRALPPLVCAALLAGCGWNSSDFEPVWRLEKVRILGVGAEPAGVEPGGATRLSALVTTPDPADPLTKLWLLCDPDPVAGAGGACAKFGTARDPGPFLRGEVPGVRVAGGDEPVYSAPADALSDLPDGSLERLRGTTATVLLVVIEGSDLSAAQDPSRLHFVIKRVPVADAAVQPLNRNPQIERVELDGALLDAAATPEVKERTTVGLRVVPSADSAEAYERITATGAREPQTEKLVASWYTTAGELPDLYDRSARAVADEPVLLEVPAAAEVPGGVLSVYVVVRDARGGIAWARRDLRVVP